MIDTDEVVSGAKNRVKTIRLRTWTLTCAILITLALYLLVNLTTKQSINWIDFAITCAMQIVIHSTYFPDGDLYGQKDAAYIANKQAYNKKATKINEDKNIAKLREFCEWEFEERKQRYVLNQLGLLNITLEELEKLKEKSEREIKHLESFEHDGKLMFFSKHKRKILYNLIFKPLPIQKNHPETIMSAVENNGSSAIRDGSVSYKAQAFIKKILMAVVVGGFFAYVGYTLRDGFGFVQVVQICMYTTTLFTTAVMAFTSGENCSRVHKSHFYLDLANFIDAFEEWLQPNANIDNIEKKLEIKNE